MSDQIQREDPARTVERIIKQLGTATAAKKCHRCGCFQDAVAALEASTLASPLSEVLQQSRKAFKERRYDCLGCQVCWPADATNEAADIVELPASAGCETDLPEPRDGWPLFPGEYRVLRFAAPVAVCTLHTRPLVEELAQITSEGLSLVGSLQTENLGIERIIENIVSNPHVRVLLLCGEDTAGRIGHFPGQSLMALVENGIDAQGRIRGAAGKRPVLQNVQAAVVDHFRRQVRIVDHRGITHAATIAELVAEASASAAGPIDDAPAVRRGVRVLPAKQPGRLLLDTAGYVVVVPDRRRKLLVAEHYRNDGVLGTVIEGENPVWLMATLLHEELVTRPDHAAYLGREFTLARRALDDGAPYIQDQAPDSSQDVPQCACDTGCGNSSAVATTHSTRPIKGSDDRPEKLHEILAVRRLTATVFVLRTERRDLPVVAGQSCLLGPPGQDAQRYYSLYSGEGDPYLEFLIKEVEGGQVSPALNRLRPGDSLAIEHLDGKFVIERPDERARRYMFFATGVGIAPFHSFVRSHPDLDYSVIHGIRTTGERFDMDDFDRSRYRSCVSREDGGDFHGRVTEYLKAYPVESGTFCYMCGNADMIWEIFEILRGQGIGQDRLFTEIFS